MGSDGEGDEIPRCSSLSPGLVRDGTHRITAGCEPLAVRVTSNEYTKRRWRCLEF